MSSSSTSTSGGDSENEGDADIVVTKSADGTKTVSIHHGGGSMIGIHSNKPFDGASFAVGLLVGVLLLLFAQRLRARRLHRPDPAIADVSRDEVAALARRTATLEQIVTDPAERTAREIDALR